jgi:hypothetical protein
VAGLLKGLSRVMGNYHARFLGGLGLATAPGYPVCIDQMAFTSYKYSLHKNIVVGDGIFQILDQYVNIYRLVEYSIF